MKRHYLVLKKFLGVTGVEHRVGRTITVDDFSTPLEINDLVSKEQSGIVEEIESQEDDAEIVEEEDADR